MNWAIYDLGGVKHQLLFAFLTFRFSSRFSFLIFIAEEVNMLGFLLFIMTKLFIKEFYSILLKSGGVMDWLSLN